MNVIGIFDSGIGGITVLKELKKQLPNEKYIYYSDSKHNPYGEKTKEAVLKYSDEIVSFLKNKSCNIIVIACNTASAISANELRKKYPNLTIIAIEPAYKMVHDYAPKGRTLVMATEGTLHSEKFNELFTKYDNHKTILLPCNGLADAIEKGEKTEINKILQKTLGKYKGKIDNVVLGCTHYPLVKKEIQEILGDVTFFDGANRLAIHLKEMLNVLSENSNEVEFFDSSNMIEKKERFFELLK